MAFVNRRVRTPLLVVPEHGPGVARGDLGLPVAAHLDGDVERPFGLEDGPDPDALVQVVVAVVALEEERRPADLRPPEPPVLDRRYDVVGAELDAVGRHLTGTEFRAQHVA